MTDEGLCTACSTKPCAEHAPPKKRAFSEFRIMRCQKCGCFIGNGGWVPFGTCKKCGERW